MKDFHNKKIGQVGEKKVAEYYLKKGFKVLQTNYRTKVGEIDLIVKKKNVLIFIEVKTRVGEFRGKPWEQINKHKLENLKKSIYAYCKDKNISIEKNSLNIHIVTVTLKEDLSLNKINQYELTFSDV